MAKESNLFEFMNGNHFLNRRIYNTKNILHWFKTINLWAQRTAVDYQVPNAF